MRAPRADGSFTALDKLRLVIVFYLSSPDNALSKDDISELEKELKSAGADVSAFDYVRRTREISRMTLSASMGSSTPTGGGAGQGGQLFGGFTSVFGNRVSLRPDLSIPTANAFFKVDGQTAGWRFGEPDIRGQELLTIE